MIPNCQLKAGLSAPPRGHAEVQTSSFVHAHGGRDMHMRPCHQVLRPRMLDGMAGKGQTFRHTHVLAHRVHTFSTYTYKRPGCRR